MNASVRLLSWAEEHLGDRFGLGCYRFKKGKRSLAQKLDYKLLLASTKFKLSNRR